MIPAIQKISDSFNLKDLKFSKRNPSSFHPQNENKTHRYYKVGIYRLLFNLIHFPKICFDNHFPKSNLWIKHFVFIIPIISIPKLFDYWFYIHILYLNYINTDVFIQICLQKSREFYNKSVLNWGIWIFDTLYTTTTL